jgi:hypothetical protein
MAVRACSSEVKPFGKDERFTMTSNAPFGAFDPLLFFQDFTHLNTMSVHYGQVLSRVKFPLAPDAVVSGRKFDHTVFLMHNSRGRAEDAKEKVRAGFEELSVRIGFNAVSVSGDFAVGKDQSGPRSSVGGHLVDGRD